MPTIVTRFQVGQPVLYRGKEHVINAINIRVDGNGSYERYGIELPDGQGGYSRDWFPSVDDLKPVPAPGYSDKDVLLTTIRGDVYIVGGHRVITRPASCGRGWCIPIDLGQGPLRLRVYDDGDFDKTLNVVAAWDPKTC